MVLATHQIQDSYATFPLRPVAWIRKRTNSCLLIKHNLRLSVRASIPGPKVKFLKILAFKGGAQSEDSGSRTKGLEVHKNNVKVSYVLKESEESVIESPKGHSICTPYSNANEGIPESPGIHKLFKNWLIMLHSGPPNQVADDVLEGPPPKNMPQTHHTPQNKERGEILKVFYCHLLRLDATIKIPLLMFVPLLLVVNVVHGAEVLRELTPLWILGPLIVAIYIKMLHSLWELYIFSFRQTVKVIKNLPTYYTVAYSYIAKGKRKESVGTRILQPVGNIENLDCNDLLRKKMKEFEEWFMEKYLDFVESIWPYYCRTIRFLKRENLF